MHRIIPIFYTEYNRYTSRFRSIPSEVDCLIPAHRRLLLSLHEMANKKLVKCAKIVGYCIGTYHCHGDIANYGSLISLYKQGFVIGQGNLGSRGFLEDGKEAGMRYPEARIKPSIDELAFKYIKQVPWENVEYEEEPMFLPSPVPVGLIGTGGVYTGIALHRTLIPRYKLSDLSKRLKYLLTKNEKDNIIIYPNAEFDGCTIQKDDVQALSILNKGVGYLNYVPEGEIKGKILHVYGKSPLSKAKITKLIEDPDVQVRDISPMNNIEGLISSKKRGIDTTTFAREIYQNYLIQKINFSIYTCDNDGKVHLKGVDDLLLNNYHHYIQVVLYKKLMDCSSAIEKKYTNTVILLIREILKDNPSVKNMNDVINLMSNYILDVQTEEWDEDSSDFIVINKTITKEDVKEVMTTKTIKSLIEASINLADDDNKINECKRIIQDNDKDCFDYVCELTEKEI